MLIFISWSGTRSRTIAEKLRDWLPDVIQDLEPWVSSADIVAGARWSQEIGAKLDAAKFGIICLTPTNLAAPWVLFEAGALAKSMTDARVCPYLIGLQLADLPSGPLTQFQAQQAHREGTWELVRSINNSHSTPLPDDRLTRSFDRCWPDLEAALANLPMEPTAPPVRPADEMLRELLALTRDLSRRLPASPSEVSNDRITRFFDSGAKMIETILPNGSMERIEKMDDGTIVTHRRQRGLSLLHVRGAQEEPLPPADAAAEAQADAEL